MARFRNIRWPDLGEIDYIHILAENDMKGSFSHQKNLFKIYFLNVLKLIIALLVYAIYLVARLRNV